MMGDSAVPRRPSLPHRCVLGMRVDQIESAQAASLITEWAAQGPVRGCYVCAGNVHMTMEAYRDAAFRAVVNGADLVVPDGVPLVWAGRLLGLTQRRRVRVTPDLLLELFVRAEDERIRVGLYGGTPLTLATFRHFLGTATPDLSVSYAWSPPFRPLTAQEEAVVVREIRDAGVQLLLVGIGCPKQERWMAAHAERAGCVMLGVGAAFDLFGGTTLDAPEWMRDRGFEWLHRVAHEPRRLWRRHLLNDPLFLVLLATQVVRQRLRAGQRRHV